MAGILLRRYPIEPLMAAAGCELRVHLARRLGVHNALVYGGAEDGITVTTAAVWCQHLGIDPESLWDDWWPPTDDECSVSATKSSATRSHGLLGELFDNSSDQSWRAQAACKGMTAMFFATDDHSRDAARATCRRCPVLTACLDDAVSRPIDRCDATITAGLTKRQRADIRHARLRAQRQVAS